MAQAAPLERPWVVRSLGRLLVLLGGVILLVAVLVAAGYREAGQPLGWTVLRVMAGAVAYTGAGAIAWWQRPSNRMGPIMVLGALVWLVSALSAVHGPVLAAVGTITRSASFAVAVHLLLAFPSGRLRSTAARWTVAMAYGSALVLSVPTYLFTPGTGAAARLVLTDRPDLARLGFLVQVAVGSAVMLATAWILVSRFRVADHRQRRALGMPYLYGAIGMLAVPVVPTVVQPLTGLSDRTSRAILLVLLIGAPVVFTVSILLGGFARAGGVQELGVWLGRAEPARDVLPGAVAGALGDPTAELVYWVPEQDTFTDAAGYPVALPGPATGRAAVDVHVRGRLAGAIVYDATMIADPLVVQQAGQVIAIALDRQRLMAALAASNRQIQQSRERIIQAGDRERRRIAQNLHDGLQAQLVLLGLEAGQLAALTETSPAVSEAATQLRSGIDDAAAGLRALVYQVMPAPLIERGLAAATEDLADRMPIPTTVHIDANGEVPPVTQSTAYFVIAEALSNAVKHSQANEITVEVSHEDHVLLVHVDDDGIGGAHPSAGFGLTGLADRVEVLAGTLRIDSPPGGGTHVSVRLPCPAPAPETSGRQSFR